MTTMTRKQAAMEFLRRAATGDVREAFRAHVGPGFRHHNPFFDESTETLMTAMAENTAQYPEKVLEVQRALEDGDLVAVHSRLRMKPGDAGIAVVHLFRFDGDRIAEMWDIAQSVPESSANRHGMF